MSQPYISWKGTTGTVSGRNSIVPSYTQSYSNGVSSNPNDFQSAFGTARPLKHWRKQLIPTNSTRTSKVSISQMNRPGGSVMIASTDICPPCNGSTDVTSTTTVVLGNYSIGPNNTFFNNASKITDADNNIFNKCISCDPESNIIKPASTNISKKYYTTHAAYMRARGNTFAQKSSPVKRPGITYVNVDGTPVYPSNSATGSQVFNIPYCETDCGTGKTVTTIYKPSNSGYSTQGAVDSGTRLARLKQITLNKNGASFTSAYGLAAANAGKYSTIASAYFVKSKENHCEPGLFRRTGIKQICV